MIEGNSPIKSSNTIAFGLISLPDNEKGEVSCVIKPDNSYKGIWDLNITL
jgi:hypothetical protein